jgi:hypothetical protein
MFVMEVKTVLLGLVASAFISAGAANAVTISEVTDFNDSFYMPTGIGSLSDGANTISGSLFTTCVGTAVLFADCTSGDDIDAFSWQLAAGSELVSASVTITNFTLTGTLDSDQLGFGRIGFEDLESDGIYTLSLTDAFITPSNRATFEVSSGTITSPIELQGTGDIGYDYILTLEVAPAVVPIPAAAWLFGSALLGLGVVKRKKA